MLWTERCAVLAFICLSTVGAHAQEHVHAVSSSTVAEGTGTSWLPAGTAAEGFAFTPGPWNVILHGQLYVQYVAESGEEHRRGQQAGSVNWFMAMAERRIGAGRLQLRGMVSLEPWTIRDCGYPNLLATGEVCNGDDIHDRQHPHELFAELAARYERVVTGQLRWELYGGVAGEPALGPVAFQHRPSAAGNPIAPIAHHWLDSSHITHGVLTAGLLGSRWKIEGSIFNGREPDEERTNLGIDRLDSVAGRIWLAPRPSLILQASAGLLREAEQSAGVQSRVDVARGTASLAYNRPHTWGGVLATTIAYGVNGEDIAHPLGVTSATTHAVLAEMSLARLRDTWFGRMEVVGKPAHDLHVHESPAAIYTVGKLQLGYRRHLAEGSALRLSAGGAAMLSLLPSALAPRYSGRMAPGVAVFLSVAPRSVH